LKEAILDLEEAKRIVNLAEIPAYRQALSLTWYRAGRRIWNAQDS